ncbi:Nramp family divalent metal transporter [Candidatus Berkelbacteria bacterium]|nr:Nramp family divalent metal transporter [Candidatus Berkelbacteria bacterium]
MGSPKRVIKEVVIDAEVVIGEIKNNSEVKKVKKYWRMLGPGLTTGAADDDPSGVATYSQAGAQYGFGLLWLSIFTFPLMAVVQEMCARIGIVTGKGLATNIKEHFPKWFLFGSTILLFAANSFNIGADLGAMAKSTQLIFPTLNFAILIILFTGVSLILQIFLSYDHYARILKWLALVLLSYIVATLMIPNLNWQEILSGAVIPKFSFNEQSILLIAAVLGTTISPYLFFWQTSQEVEEAKVKTQVDRNALKRMRIDVWSGMLLSNVVMFFIIAACGATLYVNGITNISTLEQAALALKPFAGNGAITIFTIGIIGTGLLAIPVLAGSASYAIAETFGWREGLNKSLKQARAFYGVIIISMLLGLSLNFIGLDPVKTLIYSALANGIIAPPILLAILLLSSNKKIMGEHASSNGSKIVGVLIVIIMTLASAYSVIKIFS